MRRIYVQAVICVKQRCIFKVNMIQFKQYFVPVQIQETTFCREGTRTMDARRAQDILRHIINDEDYGAAMLDKISVTESIEVLTKMLPDCVATAQNDNNINDAGVFQPDDS